MEKTLFSNIDTLEDTSPNLDSKHQYDNVCKECMEKTRILYRNNDGFFRKRLRGINHIEVGNSKIISNPITIIIESLYVLWKKCRSALNRLSMRLFPRHNKIYANNLDSYICGYVVHEGRPEEQTPLHNLKVEFWARTWLFQWRKLGDGHTNWDGYFEIKFTLRCVRNWKIKSAQVEFYRPARVLYNEKNEPYLQDERYHIVHIAPVVLIGMGYYLHKVFLPHWEYQRNSLSPRALFTDDESENSERYTPAREDALLEQVIPIELTKAKHLLQIKETPEKISIASIQADYPENLTLCIEKKKPGYTRSDEWFGVRMMNGMNQGAFMPTDNPSQFLIKYYGICNYEHTNVYALPNAEIRFSLNEKGIPLPVEITLTGPLTAYEHDPWKKQKFTPADGERWLAAKRVARTVGSVCTELDEHFAGTHVNTERYAIAAFRNFRLNPVACLLFPHLKEASLINHAADKLILGGYFPTATAITENGYHRRVRDLLGMMDWRNWQPMKPISPSHDSALAGKLFWDLISDFVEYYFKTYLEEIKNHWFEVWSFSEDLVNHAVPVYLSDVDLNKLTEQERKLCLERREYYIFQHSFDPDSKRRTLGGNLRVITPITEKKSNPDNEDIENLKAACKYAINTATFRHTWINEHQYDDLGEILYNGGGLRFGKSEMGILGPESDMTIAPDLTSSTQQMFCANLLSRTEYGFITKNEYKDVHPYLIKLMKDNEANFKKFNVDINAIESCTNI